MDVAKLRVQLFSLLTQQKLSQIKKTKLLGQMTQKKTIHDVVRDFMKYVEELVARVMRYQREEKKEPLLKPLKVSLLNNTEFKKTPRTRRPLMADLKPVYKAVSVEATEIVLDELEERWGKQYPIVIKSWRNKWHNLSVYFKYPEPIRKVIYITNAVEAVHR